MNKLIVFFTTVCLFLSFAILAHAMTVKDAPQIEDYAIYVAQHENVDASMFLGIIKAESNFQPNAKNSASSASGVLQFLDGTFRKYCIDKYRMTDTMKDKNRPTIQINCAIEMLKEPKGYMHWWASVASWGHLLAT